MTIYYVDSAAGSNTSPYNTWAKAATSLATIAGIDAAGDTVYVASTHSETGLAVNPSYAWAGTIAAPTKIICADKTSGAPPSTAATGATIATASGIALTFASAGAVYVYGLTLQAGSGTSATANLIPTSAITGCVFDTCALTLNNTSASSIISAVVSGLLLSLSNCTLKFGNTLQRIGINSFGASLSMDGCTIDGTGSAITGLLNVSAGSNAVIRACDLSACAASFNPFSTTTSNVVGQIFECKLPASWTGSPNGSIGGFGTRIVMQDCDSAGTNYVVNIEDCSGQITTNTSVNLSGGATDGTTALSWQVASNSQAQFPMLPLASPWRAVWVDTTTSKTLTWQYVADTNVAAGQGAGTAFAFQNNQVWIEAMYFGSSTSPLGTFASSAPSTPLVAPTDNAAGSGTWTTTGLTTPKQGECTLTFTTALKGPMLARICVGTASKTIYADPDPTYA